VKEQCLRQLAGYIFGGNKKRVTTNKKENESIAMTAPVMTDSNSSTKTTTMAFILPSKYQIVEDLPIPNDSSVKIEVVEPCTVAALQFSGRWTLEATDGQTKRLLEMLHDDKGVKLTVDESKVKPKIARFNPP
jgi:hypothetical protein